MEMCTCHFHLVSCLYTHVSIILSYNFICSCKSNFIQQLMSLYDTYATLLFHIFRFLFSISTYNIVFLRDCDTNCNVVKHKTCEER